MKPGIADKKIIARALSEHYIIVTKDIKLALNSLIEGVRLSYFDAEKNVDYKLVSQRVQF